MLLLSQLAKLVKGFKPVVIDAPQRSEEWFAARLGNVTGSEASKTLAYYKPTKYELPKLLAAADFEYEQLDEAHSEELPDSEVLRRLREEYPQEYILRAGVEMREAGERITYRQNKVTERLTGLPADLDPYITKDMQWGTLNEPAAKNLYAIKKKIYIEEAPLMLHPKLRAGASPDGLVVDKITGELGNCEIKCLKSTNHLYKIMKTQEVPSDYMVQIQMQMWINGRAWCDFVGFDSRIKEHRELQFFTKRVERNDFYIEWVLVPAIVRFLDEVDNDMRFFHALADEISKRGLENV